MAWTKISKKVDAYSPWGTMSWGSDPWGGGTSFWTKQTKPTDSWTKQTKPTDSWTKVTKVT